MARAGRVAWWGREDFALLTGDCSPAPSDEWGAPLRRVSFPSAPWSCPAWLADGRVTDGADGGDADGAGGEDAGREVQMGGMGEDADGADGRCRYGDADGVDRGMRMGTDADGADAESP